MRGLNIYLFFLYGCFLNVTSFLKTGTSPSSPNIALRNCMRAAGYYTVHNERNRNKFSTSMQKWCSVHERVLPCVQNSIENNSLRGPSDWFFSMTFDFKMAKRTSIAMCKKLKKFRRKLKCINSASLRRARRCVKTLTMPLRQTLTGLYMQNKTNSYDARRLACIISAATATCYKEKMRSCRNYLRDYIGAYHVIFGGKCLSVLPVTSGEFVNDSIIMPRQADRNWITVVQSLLKEVGIDFLPKSMISEIQSTTKSSLQETKSNTNQTTMPLTTSDDVTDESMFAPETAGSIMSREYDTEMTTKSSDSERNKNKGTERPGNATNELESRENDTETNSVVFESEENVYSQESNFTNIILPTEETNMSSKTSDDSKSDHVNNKSDDVSSNITQEITTVVSDQQHAYTFSSSSTASLLNKSRTHVSASSLSDKSNSQKLSVPTLSLFLPLVFVISAMFY